MTRNCPHLALWIWSGQSLVLEVTSYMIHFWVARPRLINDLVVLTTGSSANQPVLFVQTDKWTFATALLSLDGTFSTKDSNWTKRLIRRSRCLKDLRCCWYNLQSGCVVSQLSCASEWHPQQHFVRIWSDLFRSQDKIPCHLKVKSPTQNFPTARWNVSTAHQTASLSLENVESYTVDLVSTQKVSMGQRNFPLCSSCTLLKRLCSNFEAQFTETQDSVGTIVVRMKILVNNNHLFTQSYSFSVNPANSVQYKYDWTFRFFLTARLMRRFHCSGCR